MNKVVFACFMTLAVLVIATQGAPDKVKVQGRGIPPTVSPFLFDDKGCPVLVSGIMGLCVDKCANGCPEGWICCGNGCGQYCFDPVNKLGNN